MINKHNNELMNLSLSDIKRYLLAYHWELKEHPNKKISLFTSPQDTEGNNLEIYLPKTRDYEDYSIRILDALKILSLWRDKDFPSLIKDIAIINNDIFQIRILDVGPSGTIPLSVAAGDINSLKKLFIYSACAEEKSLPFYDKPLAVGVYHAELVQFGHTFEGSFGFTINSPITADYFQLSLFDQREDPPFERRVLERIIRSLNLIETSVMQDNPDILVENFDIGLNSRMCEAFLEISQEKTQEINLEISWSPKVAVSEDIGENRTWRLGRASYEVLEYAADELKKVMPEKLTIIGQIITLHSTKNPMSDEEFNRQAIIKYVYDGKSINVKLDLDRRGYRVAYEAHGKGLPIKVTGQLFRKGNMWKMVEVEEITMVLR